MSINVMKTVNVNKLFKNISKLIEQAKSNVQRHVNSELVILNWNIGKVIKIEILENKRAEYGERAVEELSQSLTMEYGRGFGRRNLFNMVKLFEVFPNQKIVQSLIAQLSWTHLIEIMHIEDDLKREFYITLCINEGWSVRVLKNRIGSMLYERTVISRKPEKTIINDLKALRENREMSKDLTLRDPYVLDFLGLKDTYSEKDVETAILKELERFILEIGTDFAFLARQKRITVDNEDYYIDLLFYHRKMKRLFVIELKMDKFKPQDKGQLELYLRWLDKYEKNTGEQSPIGIILCAGKTTESIKLLELDKSGIHVAQYLTELPPKNIFQKKLHEVVKQARLQLKEK